MIYNSQHNIINQKAFRFKYFLSFMLIQFIL